MTQPQTETIFNLYFYVSEDIISEVGAVGHLHSGSDEEKLLYLQQNFQHDFGNVLKFEVPPSFKIKVNGDVKNGIDFTSYRNLCNEGHGLLIFEKAFQFYGAPPDPLVVVTPVENGKIKAEGIEDVKMATTSAPAFFHVEKQKVWFQDYIDSEGFHFDNLINDDFIEAVRILFNAKHYVSSMKLLMICIDTVSYLEFGDVQKNFHNWLDTYVDLNKLDISSEELWEFRNSVLHMTNLDSRKVTAGKVKRLVFYVSGASARLPKEIDEGKTFSFKEMLDTLALGISKWALSYNLEKEKFEILLSRYDRIISDKRMTTTYLTDQYSG